jgi:hypothetical protein
MSAISANAANASIPTIPTIAARVKELMAKMPDTLNTKKEIDEYYKDVVKKVKEAMNTGGKAPRKALGVKEPKAPKAPKAAKAAKAEPKKRVKKVDVDADGNEIEKVKKPPNAYQKFIQDNRPKVKEDNPTMTGVEIFTLLAQKWNEHKKAMNGEESDDDKDKPDSSKSSSSKSSSSEKKDLSDDDDITEDADDKKKAAKAATAADAKSVKTAKAKNAANKESS